MSSQKIDEKRRHLAQTLRQWSVEDFHDLLAQEGVEHAFVVFENGEITLSHPQLLAPLQAFCELSHDFAEHEAVFFGREPGIPTVFLASVHDTRRGLAQGGVRFKPYANTAELLVDGLRLAQGMTRKNALAGLWWGGGKGIIALTRALDSPAWRTERTPERIELFRAYGRFVASLGGVYHTAEDIGTKTSDMNAILGANRFTTCVGSELGGSGNPSPHTARGVFRAMQAAWRFLERTDDLRGVRVAVQGVGNVGTPLVDLLDDAGALVWATDVDSAALAALCQRRPRVRPVAPEEIFDLDVDVFAPCAIGAQVNARTIPRLEVRLICGGANNILEEPADGERLRERGITFVPDYLCNRMGITNCADEWQGYLEADVALAAERVYPDTLRVLKHARSQMITPSAAADQLADLAAAELHPLMGHRGRRVIDHLIATGWHHKGSQRNERGQRARSFVPAFVPALDEPRIRLGWEEKRRSRPSDAAVAATPVLATGRPDLAVLFSPLLADVRARALEQLDGRPRRRLLGADPGGLALQLAVERTLPWEREEIGRSQFLEQCHDFYRTSDAAIREQLHELGVIFDSQHWLDTLSEQGRHGVRRLFRALGDADLLVRERRLSFFDPGSQTVLVSPDVSSTRIEVPECFVVSWGGARGEIETQTFHPELLAGAAALAVRTAGRYAELVGTTVRNPLDGRELPVLEVAELATEAKFLVPAHHREDHELARAHGLDSYPEVIDLTGRVHLPGEPPLAREEARRRVIERLGPRLTRLAGRFHLDAFRSRGSENLVELGTSEQLFVRLEKPARKLARAIDSGAVRFSDERWRRRVLDQLAAPEPWCISRQHWWGHPLPGREGEEVLSSWFALAALSLSAAGWPESAEPEPIEEVTTDPDHLARWVVPSQMLALQLTGRPVFQNVHVHGALHVVERALKTRDDAPTGAPDEERFLAHTVKRPMRRRLGNSVEPTTLVRRFGADALRLGYLLSLAAGTAEAATLTEAVLRRARRTVDRLSSKVAGLFRVAEEGEESPALLADAWVLARAHQATEAAQAAYRAERLGEVATLLAEIVDDFGRYSAIAAARRQRGGRLGAIRATTTALIADLARGFAPVCPFLFEKLGVWTRAHTPTGALEGNAIEPWVVELVAHLARRPGQTIELGSGDGAAQALLAEGWDELEALARVEVKVTEMPTLGVAEVVGPCVVVTPGEGQMPAGATPAAMWYRALHA